MPLISTSLNHFQLKENTLFYVHTRNTVSVFHQLVSLGAPGYMLVNKDTYSTR